MTEAEIQEAVAYNNKRNLTNQEIDYLVVRGAELVQTENDLVVDGKVGPVTRSYLPDQVPLVAPGIPQGKGIFIRSLSHTGTPEQMLKRCEEAGIDWVAVQAIWQYFDKDSKITKLSREHLRPLQEEGIGLHFWGWPVPMKNQEFAGVLFEAVNDYDAQGVIADIEPSVWEGDDPGDTWDACQLLMEDLLKHAVWSQVHVGVTSVGPVWKYPNMPWEMMAMAHYGMGQGYDMGNNLGPDYPQRVADAFAAKGFRAHVPATPAFNKTEEQFSALHKATPYPMGAFCLWDWFNATENNLWDAIAELEIP